jgi:hypothetical protein
VPYRTCGSTGFKLEDADLARGTFLAVLAYLRRRHPDVSFRCFGEEDGRLAWFYLFQDAADADALMRVRQTTAADPAFLELGASIADHIVEASSQPHPYFDLES